MMLFQPILADKNVSFWFPEQASTFAAEIDWFFNMITLISVVFFVLIVGAMVYFIWKYRERPGYRGSPEALHNTPLEITWTVVPTFIVIWIFAQGTVGYVDMATPPQAGTLDIEVVAQKWNWQFIYPNGAITTELHLPVDRPAKLKMRSVDVIHSLFVPAFRAKCDIVPGRYNYMWFQPTKANAKADSAAFQAAVDERNARIAKSGNKDEAWNYDTLGFTPDGFEFYDLFCTEYCGDSHSKMIAQVVVHEPGEFEKWIAEAAEPPMEDPVEWGLWLYQRVGCKSCHSVDGSKVVGPSFKGSWAGSVDVYQGDSIAFDDNYVRESIIYPQAKARTGYESASAMPSYQGRLKEEEISALTAYIKSLQ